MANVSSVASKTVAESRVEENGEVKIPLFEEEFSVSKRVVPTSRVQVSRVTHNHEQLIDEMLKQEKIEIEKIPVNKPVDTMPSSWM